MCPRRAFAFRCFVLSVGLATVFSSRAQAPQPPASAADPISHHAIASVDIVDLSPKFLDFYAAAVQSAADPEQRWQLWKQKYDFAAVPPIAAGQKMAREHLDEAWPKYPDALDRIRHGASAITPSPQAVLQQVAALLGATRDVHIRLIAFVGTFHREAFAMGLKNGVSTVAIPLEDSDQDHTLDLTHEFTHAVEMQQGGWTGQSVASAVFTEGLATQVTRHLLPGSAANVYTASTPEWMQECSNKLPEVLRDLKAHLSDQGPEAVSQFTFGTGAAGLQREIYCGGWFVVGRLLRDGATYPQLGNLSRPEAEQKVASTIDLMLGSDQDAVHMPWLRHAPEPRYAALVAVIQPSDCAR